LSTTRSGWKNEAHVELNWNGIAKSQQKIVNLNLKHLSPS